MIKSDICVVSCVPEPAKRIEYIDVFSCVKVHFGVPSTATFALGIFLSLHSLEYLNFREKVCVIIFLASQYVG